MGRLGNQLFQISATIAAAIPAGLKPVFPESHFAKWFDIDTQPEEWFQSGRWTVVAPKSFLYDPSVAPRAAQGGITLEGWFQSDKYFADCEDLIRRTILTQRVLDLRASVARQHAVTQDEITCAVHLRRGDYLKYADRFTQLSIDDYYIPAMAWMKANKAVERFVIVSDDLIWCRKQFRGDQFIFSRNTGTLRDRLIASGRHRTIANKLSPRWSRAVDEHETVGAIRDLLLMSACRHHIIANSSFSWWSSWLSEPSDRTVIAPRVWVEPAMELDTRDIYRDDMLQL
jgi:hypothetical protein